MRRSSRRKLLLRRGAASCPRRNWRRSTACIRQWSAIGSARRWKAWRLCSRARWRRKTPSGKERSRNCTRRSANWWWSGIFWPRPPVDEHGSEATIDRLGPSRPVDRASVRAGFGQPLDVLPGTGAGDGAEPDVDAAPDEQFLETPWYRVGAQIASRLRGLAAWSDGANSLTDGTD